MEPGDVPDLPAHRIDDAQPRSHELLVGEVVDELAGTHASIADVRFERRGFDLPRRRNAGRNDNRVAVPVVARMAAWRVGWRVGWRVCRAAGGGIADGQDTKPHMGTTLNISVITPAAKRSLSGNRATAVRWARILEALGHSVTVAEAWPGEGESCQESARPPDLLVAIHAWRSARSVTAFRERYPGRPLVVLMSGTDIYRFQHSHPDETAASDGCRPIGWSACMTSWPTICRPGSDRSSGSFINPRCRCATHGIRHGGPSTSASSGICARRRIPSARRSRCASPPTGRTCASSTSASRTTRLTRRQRTKRWP